MLYEKPFFYRNLSKCKVYVQEKLKPWISKFIYLKNATSLIIRNSANFLLTFPMPRSKHFRLLIKSSHEGKTKGIKHRPKGRGGLKRRLAPLPLVADTTPIKTGDIKYSSRPLSTRRKEHRQTDLSWGKAARLFDGRRHLVSSS